MKRHLRVAIAVFLFLAGCSTVRTTKPAETGANLGRDGTKVIEAEKDFNGDGRIDLISIWLTEGKKYNDTDMWEGQGEKYEGQFVIRVEINGGKNVSTNLNKLFYPPDGKYGRMFFWTKAWELAFADYNHDGQLDFNLGQYASGVASKFRLFTVSSEDAVSELPVAGNSWGFLGPVRTHSTTKIEATDEGFTHRYYCRRLGRGVQRWYRWNKEKKRFELSKQEPPEKGLEQTDER